MRDLYQLTMSTVCRHTGFSEMQILHDRRELCTDARYLLVHLLSEKLRCHEIVHLSGLPKQTVSQIINSYSDRARWKHSLRCCEKEVREELQGEE